MCSKRKAAAALLVLLEEEHEENKRSVWTKNLYLRRFEKGHYENLVKELALEDEYNYRRLLRMDLDTFNLIVFTIKLDIQKQCNHMRDTISPEECVALTLRFLATGDSYQSLSFAFRVSTSSISTIVPEVCSAIYNNFKDTYMKVASTTEEWSNIAQQFFDLWNFPNCLGAIDGKHVVIEQPPKSGSHFYNYKGTFSIVLMAIADADLKFVFVDVGTNGRISDGGVWRKSKIRELIDNNYLAIPNAKKVGNQLMPYVFIGDEALPLKTYLMKPFSAKDLNTEKRVFNYRLSRARRVVENAFGILSNVWRVYRRPIALTVDNAKKVVMATTVLHNLLRSKSNTRNIYTPPNYIDVENIDEGLVEPGLWRNETEANALKPLRQTSSNHHSDEAKIIRQNFSNYFINEGQVSWQWKYAYVNERGDESI